VTLFFLRDDDINATTDLGRFRRAYAPLLDAGIPLNLATVPEVALDTPAPDGSRERFIGDSHPPSDATVAIEPDSELAKWVRATPGVEPLVHVLQHRRVREGTEFGALTRDEARTRMDAGLSRLERCFGRRPIGFVAPWDLMSPGSVAAALERFPLLSTCFVDRHRLPITAWPAHVLERRRRDEVLRVRRTWVLRHRGGKITADTRPDEVPALMEGLAERARVAVVVLHHWMYWHTDPEPHPAIVAMAAWLKGRQTVSATQLLETL
jgi:hypothetical protein